MFRLFRIILICFIMPYNMFALRTDIYRNNFINPADTGKDYFNMSYSEFCKLKEVLRQIDPSNPDYNLINASVFQATNQQRIKHKIKPFIYSPALEKAAMVHSANMCKNNNYSHIDNKNPELREPEDRIKKYGGKYLYTGENINNISIYKIKDGEEFYVEKENDAYVYYKASTDEGNEEKIGLMNYFEIGSYVVENWMLSKGHKYNILYKYFTEIGCGVYLKPAGNNGYSMPELFITQDFGGK